MWEINTITVNTHPRQCYDLSSELQQLVTTSNIHQGLCHLFIQHTSASLMICENADPQVRIDLENFLQHLVPDGSPLFQHTAEGPDDMPAHIRTLLTRDEITIPIREHRLALGRWQGIYLYEHRLQGHQRRCLVSLHGESL